MPRSLVAVLAAAGLVAGVSLAGSSTATSTATSTSAGRPPVVDPGLEYGFQGEGGLYLADRDGRAGVRAPSVAQRAAVAALGARAQWGPLGSPLVLTRDDAGYLSAPRAGAATDVARAFVRANAAAFGLSAAQTVPAALEMVSDYPLYEGPQLRAKMARKPVSTAGLPHVITFRQVYGSAASGIDGLLTVAVTPNGKVSFASSSVTGQTGVTNTVRLRPVDALLAAAKDVDLDVRRGDLRQLDVRTAKGAKVFTLRGVRDDQTTRVVAVPTPRDGVRLAYETVLLKSAPDKERPYAYLSHVDAQTGAVLHRSNRLQHSDDSSAAPGQASVPYYRVFPANPPFPVLGMQTRDTRVFWCFAAGPECTETLGTKGGKPNPASPYAYDENLTATGQRQPTFSTDGNNARTAISRFSQLTPDTLLPTVSATRTYDFPFTDQWHTSNCNPTSFGSPNLNDADASTTNLNVMHNRMHDWGYYLGWTEENSNMQKENVGSEADVPERENDPEIGNAQSGSVSGGVAFTGRDNANQVTLGDGTPGVSNQYLWEPLQAGFYPPCVDGAYDMSVVGHEVGHAIQGRMTAKSDGLSGAQARSMGESWSDLTAIEYVNGYGYVPVGGEDPFAVGAFATAEKIKGIRNYNMSDSPLNYSDLEYDGNGVTSPHADGEIWSATQFDIREAMNAKYDGQFSSNDKALQFACADGVKASTACPGNRRWIQMIHDGFLLQPSKTSMLTSRDAILAANKTRYRGADLPVLWKAFAKRGMGQSAESKSADDLKAVPGFDDPLDARDGAVRFRVKTAAGVGVPEETNVYVGTYEARITPLVVAEGSAVTAAVPMVPGVYQLYLQAKGFGHRRMTVTVQPGAQTIDLPVRKNLASVTNGAKVSGDGAKGGPLNHTFIADDTEATNWASVRDGSIKGKQVTVQLAGGAQTVLEVQVSAANRPRLCAAAGDTNEPDDIAACEESREAPYDTGGQNRFAPVRSFEILTCDATAGKACTDAGDYTSSLVARDAFPADRPRPTAPDLQLRTFALPTAVKATHVRIKVIDNQCTGGPEYTRERNPDSNPLSDPDCEDGMTFAAATDAPNTTISLSQATLVRISELQVFGSRTVAVAAPPAAPPTVTPPGAAPPPAAPPSGPLAATGPGSAALPGVILFLAGLILWRLRTAS